VQGHADAFGKQEPAIVLRSSSMLRSGYVSVGIANRPTRRNNQLAVSIAGFDGTYARGTRSPIREA